MAITFFGGPPGAGKSYALVEQVIVPNVLAGRRVLTNVAGVDPDKVWRYCCDRTDEPSRLGKVITFDGSQAIEPGFFPTEKIPDTDTFVKGGDLIVFDEWRLYWPRRGTLPSPDLEPFLRWHRHLCSANGVACDLAIASQLATDVHQDFRGLIERSYKFRKLKSVGMQKTYAWEVFEGHLQPKGGAYTKGNGTYKDEITALYSSYATSGSATELQTDQRASLFKRWYWYVAAAGALGLVAAIWAVYSFFTTGAGLAGEPPAQGPATFAVGSVPAPSIGAVGASAPLSTRKSKFRIVGHLLGDEGTRIVLADDTGVIRIVPGTTFIFDGERPISGTVDGETIYAEDRFKLDVQPGVRLGL